MRLKNLYGKDYQDWNNSQDDLLINMKQRKKTIMKNLIKKIILSDVFVKAFIYICAILFTLIFSINIQLIYFF